jgi:hypothetical protein
MPTDSFERFMGLGPNRTYQKLADVLGVSKRSVVRRARRDGWQARIARIQVDAQVKVDAKLADDVADVNERHLKTLRVLQAKALQGLSSMALRSPMDCVRTLDLAIKAERSVLGKDKGEHQTTLEELVLASMDRDGLGKRRETPT